MRRDKYTWAIGLFIVSEATFFVYLIIAYINFHFASHNGPEAARTLDTLKTGLYTIALLASSATLWRADASRKHESHPGLFWWLLATLVLGAVFLFGQGREYARLMRQDVTISRDLFGSTFFTLTGFHGFHVLIGLAMIGILCLLAVFGRRGEPQPAAVETISLYWHFVDAVWIVIFGVIYLWALFL